MSSTNIYLLQSNIQSHLQKRYFECRYIRIYSEEKMSKMSNITFAIKHFSLQNTLTKLPTLVLWNPIFLMKPLDTLQDGSFRVRQFQACYLHKTHLRALNSTQY